MLKTEAIDKTKVEEILDEVEAGLITHGSQNRPKESAVEKQWLSKHITFAHQTDSVGNIWATTCNKTPLLYCVEINHAQKQKRQIICTGNQIIGLGGGEWEMEKDAGCSLMLTMIRHRIPGQYLFLRSGGYPYPEVEATVPAELGGIPPRFAIIFWRDAENPGRPIVLEPNYTWVEGSLNQRFKLFARDREYNEQAMHRSPMLKRLREKWTCIGVNPGCGYNAISVHTLRKIGTELITENLINHG
jgi:hypothetical protein